MARDRRILLAVDDVWSDAAAAAFQVTGPHRDATVLAAIGAREYPIGVLTESQARAVAGRVLGQHPDALPATADAAALMRRYPKEPGVVEFHERYRATAEQ